MTCKCGAYDTAAMPAFCGHSPEWCPEPRIYRIIRFRFNGRPRTLKRNVTLTEAQAHCSREDTHGVRAGVRWFDGYDYMPGCKPKERS